MYRYKIVIEYSGKNFSGWQRQLNAISVQQVLEDAIFSFSNRKVSLVVAARTDAKVGAYNQVAHFDIDKYYQPNTICSAINHFALRNLIGVKECFLVDQDFHARYSATQRHYVYKIINQDAVSIIDAMHRYWFRRPLNIDAMQEATKYLLGKHDFSTFRASGCQASTPITTINNAQITKINNYIDFNISANFFLYHMVRNIVGSLIEIGLEKRKPEWIKELINLRDRKKAGVTAPAIGLYLLRVDY